MHRSVKTGGLLCAGLFLIAGCTRYSPALIDVSTPSNVEWVEFDGIVDAPINVAYANVLSKAQYCWRTDYSGEIEAVTGFSPRDPAQIRFVVPGKMVGSRIPLTTVRLFSLQDNQTRVVGVSSVLPGKWHLDQLESWAKVPSSDCAAAPAT